MVKAISLFELGTNKAVLINTVNLKLSKGKVSGLNARMNKKLTVDIVVVKELVEAIEQRLREAEIIFYSYLEQPDHALLCGNTTSLPVLLQYEFSFGTTLFNKRIEINDRLLYKEIIDVNFRHFILLIASIYENIVLLLEILTKKIYLHLSKTVPISMPFHDYIEFLKALIDFGYRKSDHIFKCVMSRDIFFSKYLIIVNALRNSFMHGYKSNLESNKSTYRVIDRANTGFFTAGSPDLELDVFTKTILEETRLFFREIIDAVLLSIKHPSKLIPS